MKLAINETYYFYHQCLKGDLNNFERKQLVELLLKYPHLRRFAALLPIHSTTELALTETQKVQFNATKMAIIATNLKQQTFIKSFARELESHSITVILLKSSGLNGYLYPNQHCRGNSDIDLLIRSKDREQFEELLSNVAYPHQKTDSQPFDGLYEQTWISKKDPTLFIDVHTELTNPKLFTISNENIFSLSMEHPIYNTPAIRVMDPLHNFIHSALHIFGDGYLPHHSLVDAALIYKKGTINWKSLEGVSDSWGCLNITKLLFKEIGSTMNIKNVVKGEVVYSLRLKLGRYILNKQYPVKSRRRKLQQAFLQITLIDNFKRVLLTQLEYLRTKFLG
jgi:hypothetical protein